MEKEGLRSVRVRIRLDIGEDFQCWKDVGEGEGLKTDAEVALSLLDTLVTLVLLFHRTKI